MWPPSLPGCFSPSPACAMAPAVKDLQQERSRHTRLGPLSTRQTTGAPGGSSTLFSCRRTSDLLRSVYSTGHAHALQPQFSVVAARHPTHKLAKKCCSGVVHPSKVQIERSSDTNSNTGGQEANKQALPELVVQRGHRLGVVAELWLGQVVLTTVTERAA